MRVGQPSGAPDGSAALEVSGGPYDSGSLYRGILPPKVALTQTSVASPVTTPATGLLIYNTAKTGDVTPGYYYWEGNKWMRLSTSATGAGRVAAVGDPIPAYTYSQAKALTTAPGEVFMLTEPGQEGLFRNANVPTSSQDTVSANGIRDVSGNIIASGTIMVVGGQRYKRVVTDGVINIKWFGAVGQADATDDGPAIQKAVNYAKFIVTTYGTNSYKSIVTIPPGHYRIRKTIDVTRASGVVIRGSAGRYLNSSLVGNTNGIMLDFTGSSMSGCENLFFQSYVQESNPSTIGVQFALEANAPYGGPTCVIKNCFMMLADIPTANNGMGTVGIMNCRAEEFAVTDCVIQANIGCIFSNKNNLADAGFSYTVSSAYAPVATGQGSLGVINFNGQNSITNLGKAQPALILNGTNSVNFHGYLSRASVTGSGTNEAAILFCGAVTYNATINTTVESFAQLIRAKSPLVNCTINGVVANQINAGGTLPSGTTRHPVIDLSGGGQLQGCKVNITFGEAIAERDGRYLLYDGGPIYAGLLNSEISCPQWDNNSYVASTIMFSNTDNTIFKLAYPFKVESGISKQLFSSTVSAGVVGTVTTATVARWRNANSANPNFNKAGIYSISVEGTVRVGWAGAGGQAVASFKGTLSIAQNYVGAQNASAGTVILLDQASTAPTYCKVAGVALTVDVSDPNVYKINVTPAVTGNGTGEPITVSAVSEVKSDFAIKGAILFP